LDDGDRDKALLRVVYTLFRGISYVSDDVDEEDEVEFDLVSEDVTPRYPNN